MIVPLKRGMAPRLNLEDPDFDWQSRIPMEEGHPRNGLEVSPVFFVGHDLHPWPAAVSLCGKHVGVCARKTSRR
jgi:hypothetical protein